MSFKALFWACDSLTLRFSDTAGLLSWDFLTRLRFFLGGCQQNNVKYGNGHKVLTEDEFQGLVSGSELMVI